MQAPDEPAAGDVRSPARFALITPSYAGDFERCRLLVRTARAHLAPHVQHLLLVDRRDEGLFSSLTDARTEVVPVESLLPDWLFRVPFARTWWASLRTRPVRNWILQQIAKLSVDQATDADVLIYADSDVFFVGDYDPRAMVENGRIPLFREEGPQVRSEFSLRWHQTAARLLGLPVREDYLTAYVGNLVPWRRDHLVALHERIEAVSGRGWVERLCAESAFSEYVLYGLFVEEVLGAASGHFPDETIPTLNYWPDRPLDEAGLAQLHGRVRPEHVAVMISSKSRTPVEAIERVFGNGQGYQVRSPEVATAS